MRGRDALYGGVRKDGRGAAAPRRGVLRPEARVAAVLDAERDREALHGRVLRQHVAAALHDRGRQLSPLRELHKLLEAEVADACEANTGRARQPVRP